MKISKNQWTIIGIVIGALAIYYFFIRKNKMSVESGYRKGSPALKLEAVCKYSNGDICTCGTPNCNSGTLE